MVERVTEHLYARGVGRRTVEDVWTKHTQFLKVDLALVRVVSDGRFALNPDRRATPAEVPQTGDVVLKRYALSARFDTV